jgi:hypothetical protein
MKTMQNKLVILDFEGEREVLDILDIKVWLYGEKVEITCAIPVENDTIANISC